MPRWVYYRVYLAYRLYRQSIPMHDIYIKYICHARMRIYNEYTKVALLQALIIKEKILQN